MVRYIKESIEDDFDEFDFGDESAEWYDGIDTPKECIKGATLLSKEEYEKYEDNIPEIARRDWWWLRTPGCSNRYASCIDRRCDVNKSLVCNICGGIRPALILSPQSFDINIKVGDKFEFGGHIFTTISSDLAICDKFISEGCFRKYEDVPDANIYEKSDVKKEIDEWFNNAMRSE